MSWARQRNEENERECIRLRDEVDNLHAEVERLRAYLPLARAAAVIDGWNWWAILDPTARDHCEAIVRAFNALSPEQQARLMEDK